MLTRLNGCQFALNPDLIERAEQTPDTVITLVDGARYVVAESLHDIIASIHAERARVLAMTGVVTEELEPNPRLHAVADDAPVVPLRRKT